MPDGLPEELDKLTISVDVLGDTVEEQIAIAKRKAGIGEKEEVRLERFEVVRHY